MKGTNSVPRREPARILRRCQREWILKVALIERRQLPDELRHTDVFEVNDLADGLLVVGILVQPAHLFRRRQVGRQGVKGVKGVKGPRYLGLKRVEKFLLRPFILISP
jgi:hypothetical protein